MPRCRLALPPVTEELKQPGLGMPLASRDCPLHGASARMRAKHPGASEAAAKQVVAQNAQALRIHFVGNMLLRRYPRLRQNAFPSRRRAHVQAAFRTKRKMRQRGRFPDGRKIQGIVIAAFVIRQGAGFGFRLSGRERQDGGMPPLLRRVLCRQGRPVAFRCLRGDDQRASGTVPGLHGVQEIPFLFRRQFQFAGEFEYLGGRHEIRPGMFLRSGC